MDAPYGLTHPTVEDARDAVFRVHGADAASIWDTLLRTAGVSSAAAAKGSGAGPGSVDTFSRLLTVMEAADPVTGLCALALRIRLTSYTHLSAAHRSLT
ncbi:hypothetical protein [Actinoplanes rectilineatus]|uniref:hypothetical protein n=1 Tax=Actinoplanes rectilineatus TaxID=113571 RepID=UPI0005F2EFD1|nr:hypothetical protein [Actinoplanes rectilineatus]